ncbi:MAG: NAD+ synthase [Nitrospirota bacterium]
MKTIRISMAQINPLVGDLAGNRDKILDFTKQAKEVGTDIVVFPELAVPGYPPEDLVLKPQFVKDNLRILKEITKATQDIVSVVGFVDAQNGHLYDAAAVISSGRLVHVYHKMLLPNYGVFDEYRYFKPGKRYPVLMIRGVNVGLNICEDIWYADGPARIQTFAGAEIIVSINASPYHKGKGKERMKMLSLRARENNAAIVYTNVVGGQDELVFDGHSLAFDANGKLIAAGKQFEEDIITLDYTFPVSAPPDMSSDRLLDEHQEFLDLKVVSEKPVKKRRPLRRSNIEPPYSLNEEIYHALVLGTRDYVTKNGFKSVVIGLSGGLDSSIVAAVAVDAIGKENVFGVFMPSFISSQESREDAVELAQNLGIRMFTIPIHQPFDSFLNILRGAFANTVQDVTEENLQARIRGNILMALSNKFGWLVLTTGNKSEMSVGYATLYGDMAGGFAMIKDLPKTLVYDVSRSVNRRVGKIIIPKRVLVKDPTAELRPNQKDSDSLPPYSILDPILKAYVEDDKDFNEILKMGFDRKTVKSVIRMVDSSEYKRRQAPPGIKITPRSLGKDRRFPITNRYKSY